MKKFFRLYIFLFLTLFLFSGCDVPRQKIAIIPLGPVQERFLLAAKSSIEQFYHFQVDILKPLELPPGSYYKPRDRYNASYIVRWLKVKHQGQYHKILGLTQKDIYHAREGNPYRGVIGLGLIHGRAALVSVYRYVRLKKDGPEKLLERLSKTVVHELGHTYGLKHCTKGDHCIMRSSNGKAKNVDKKEAGFCKFCVTKIINKNLFELSEGEITGRK